MTIADTIVCEIKDAENAALTRAAAGGHGRAYTPRDVLMHALGVLDGRLGSMRHMQLPPGDWARIFHAICRAADTLWEALETEGD